MSTLLRLFVKNHLDGRPTFEVTAAPEILHYLFPQKVRPGCEPCPFTVRLIPTSTQDRVADLSLVLNTRQIKPNEDHYELLPSAYRVRSLLAAQPAIYPPPSAHPLHLRFPRERSQQDPELAHLPGYQRMWIHPTDVAEYFTEMGYRYIGSHVESCGNDEDIWDVHTYVGGEKLKALFGMLTPPQESLEDSLGRPSSATQQVEFSNYCKHMSTLWIWKRCIMLRLFASSSHGVLHVNSDQDVGRLREMHHLTWLSEEGKVYRDGRLRRTLYCDGKN